MSTAANLHSISSAKPSSVAGLHLSCPQCREGLGTLPAGELHPELVHKCTNCGFRLVHEDGIWKALPTAREAHFSRFLREYQAVRQEEGRGSSDPEYYLALPYRDLSGRNKEQWAIRAQTYRYLESRVLPPVAAACRRPLDILDLGAGNGWMSYRLALQGHRPVAVDLLVSATDGLGSVSHYQSRLQSLFPCFQAEVDALPFANGQFDLAIFNASFHYSENYAATLGEAIRCLRARGKVIIADTAWYTRDESGQQMLAERQSTFVNRYGFPSDGLASLEYLTDERLAAMEESFGTRWEVHSPFYGMRWAMRPLLAKAKSKREPSRFRIYVAEVNK